MTVHDFPGQQHKVSELHQAGVDLARLVELLGDNLYSRPDVFLRELVQNAHDAITRRQLESSYTQTPYILISGSRNATGQPILVIEDTGSGLTAPEIHQYLATVGRGFTGQMRLRQMDAGPDSNPLVGAFGLGFLSAYVVSETVLFITTSYQTPNETWAFFSRGGNSYSVEPWSESRPIGTRLELTLKPEFERLYSHAALYTAAARSCALLAHPIYISTIDKANRINAAVPPWRNELGGAPWIRWHADALNWLKSQEDAQPPLAVMPAGRDPGSPARGIIWLNDFHSFANNDNRAVKVYIRNMLVADNERELLPYWAGFASATIEADTLTPTLSREGLRRDDAYAAVRKQLEQDLLHGLASFANAGPETAEHALWKRVLSLHNHSLVVACCADDSLMQALRSSIELETSAGRFTVPALAELGDGCAYISSGRSGVDALFAKVKGMPVVDGRLVGHQTFLERYFQEQPENVIRLGQTDHSRIFPPKTPDPALDAFVRYTFAQAGEQLKFSAFDPAGLPLIRVWDEFALARERLGENEEQRRVSAGALRLAKTILEKKSGPDKSYLYINLASPIWPSVLAAPPAKQAAAVKLLQGLVVLLDENASPDSAKALEIALQQFVGGLSTLVAEA